MTDEVTQPIPEPIVSGDNSGEPVKDEALTTTEKPSGDLAEKPKVKGGFQNKIDKLTRKNYELQQKLEEAQRSFKPEVSGSEPKVADYENYEAYVDARAEWKADQAVEKKLAAREEKLKQDKLKQEDEKIADTWADKKEAAREKYVDFDDVINNEEATITPHMSRAIVESDKGADIAYHLGKNPELAEKIASMTPARQMVEIGKLEVSLSHKPRPSSAPAPINPVSGSATASDSPSDKDDVKDWMKKEEARMRAKGLL